MRLMRGSEKKLTQLVRERRATSAFSASPVSEDDLNMILRAGLEAPSTNQALSSFIASLRTTVCTTMITVCMIIAWQRT